MRAEAGVETTRRGQSSHVDRERLSMVRRATRLGLVGLLVVGAGALAAGIIYAGSAQRIPEGVTLAGIGVGGLTASEAERRLEVRAAQLRSVPVLFTAEDGRWSITPEEVDVRVDWRAAVAEALATGDGPVPFRGLERLRVRLFGAELEPHANVYEPALSHQVDGIAKETDIASKDAALMLRGLRPDIVPAESGRQLDGAEASRTIVAALAGFERRPVPLPVAAEEPTVTADDLAAAVADVRRALSAPIRFGYGDAHWGIRPDQFATFLNLPNGGATDLAVGGTAVERYFRELNRGVVRQPRNADFRLLGNGRVRVVPAVAGRGLDRDATAAALLRAALSETKRDAELVVRSVPPAFTTEEARGLRISRALASYGTTYSGTSDRIRNLQLAVAALDGTVLRPGQEFSFNKVVGPRTERRGYGPAPVIIDGEYEEGIGGGVSQVATTVFNTAWEAGLKITSRTAHALYISRYQLGRDATVNYPDVDLRFLNDTKKAIYVRAGYDDTGISITFLGAETNRRVESVAGPLRVAGRPKVERIPDPNLFVGERVVEDHGEPPRTVTVTRAIYVRGELLRRETWTTNYRYEERIVRVGTKVRPQAQTTKPPPATTTTKTTKATTTPTTTSGG